MVRGTCMDFYYDVCGYRIVVVAILLLRLVTMVSGVVAVIAAFTATAIDGRAGSYSASSWYARVSLHSAVAGLRSPALASHHVLQ